MKSKELIAEYDNESIGYDEDEEIIVDIHEASKATLIDSISRLYEQPIESICREICSNCFDSHIEANIEDAVEIGFNIEDGNRYIYFKDVGTGMSPEFIKTIYGKIGASTRRESDLYIGAKGYGSKSPISYRDEFYITTNFEGIKYKYIYSKDKYTQPKINIINKSETNDRNGTTIKIFLKDSDYNIYPYRDEKTKWINALNEQLAYFDNVYFKDNICENNYKIYDFKSFKYRPDSKFEKLHIVYGKVYYPINFKMLGIEQINLPFAIKFEIGDLRVTPDREAIEYKDEEIKLIKEKIKEFEAELENIVFESSQQYDDIIDYWKYIESDELNFRNIEIKASGILKEKKLKLSKFKNFNFNNEKIGEYINSVVQVKYVINKGRKKDTNEYLSLKNLQRNDIYRIKDKINTRVNTFLGNALLISTNHPKHQIKYLFKLLSYVMIKRNRYDYDRYRSEYVKKEVESKLFVLKPAKQIYNEIKTVKNEILSSLVKRSKKYEEIESSQEFKDHLNSLKGTRSTLSNNEVIINSISDKDRLTVKFDHFKRSGFYIIGTKEEKDKLTLFNSVLESRLCNSRIVRNGSFRTKFEVFYTANKNLIPITGYISNFTKNKVGTMEDLLSTNNSVTRKIANRIYVYHKLENVFGDNFSNFIANIKPLNKDIYNKAITLLTIKKNFNSSFRDREIYNFAINIILEKCKDYIDPTYDKYIEEIQEYFSGIEILGESKFSEDLVLPILLISNKKVDSKYSFHLRDYEKELLEESDEKFYYLAGLGDNITCTLASDLQTKEIIRIKHHLIDRSSDKNHLIGEIRDNILEIKNHLDYERAYLKSQKNRQKLQCCGRFRNLHQSS